MANFAKDCEGARIEKVIWTNPSPSNDFTLKNINCDLSTAAECKIVAQFYPSGGIDNIQYGQIVEITVPVGYSGDIKMFSHTGASETESVYIWTRQFTTFTSKVFFNNCVLRLANNSSYSSTQNSYCIPLSISAVNYLSLGGGGQ